MGWWQVGEDLIRDPGAFGASAWIHTDANYAAYWVIEDSFWTTLTVEPELRSLIHEALTGEPLT